MRMILTIYKQLPTGVSFPFTGRQTFGMGLKYFLKTNLVKMLFILNYWREYLIERKK